MNNLLIPAFNKKWQKDLIFSFLTEYSVFLRTVNNLVSQASLLAQRASMMCLMESLYIKACVCYFLSNFFITK